MMIHHPAMVDIQLTIAFRKQANHYKMNAIASNSFRVINS